MCWGVMDVSDNMYFFHITAKGRPYLPKLRKKELLKQGSWYHSDFIASSQVLGHSPSKISRLIYSLPLEHGLAFIACFY